MRNINNKTIIKRYDNTFTDSKYNLYKAFSICIYNIKSLNFIKN